MWISDLVLNALSESIFIFNFNVDDIINTPTWLRSFNHKYRRLTQ
jgi:hypothetical protein